MTRPQGGVPPATWLVAAALCAALIVPEASGQQLAYIGVNWGRAFSQTPLPDTQSFTILKNKGIRKIKLFNHNVNVVNAINATIGSTAQVILGIPNGELSNCATNYSFVLALLTPHQPYKAIIKQVAVSNEPDTQWSAADLPGVLLPAIANVRKALSALGMSARVVVPFAAGVVSNSYPPSAGVFGSSWLPTIAPLLQTLNATGSAFMINLYPYFAWRYNQAQISLDYALSKPSASPVTDSDLTYRSLLDAMYDATLAALDRAGYPSMPLVIGESGWPTAGDQGASADLACYYNNRMVKKASSVSTGTPRRPGQRVLVYVFSAFDELKKPGPSVEPYWGTMTEAGADKYTLDWTSSMIGIPCAGQPTQAPTKAPTSTTATSTTTSAPSKTPTKAPSASTTTSTSSPTKAPSKAPSPSPPTTTKPPSKAPTKAPTTPGTAPSPLPLPPLPAPVAGQRVLVFQNAGNVSVFLGMIGTRTSNGQQLASINPQATGFELAPGASKVISVPDDLSGRTWVRTGCRWMTLKTGCSQPNQGTPLSQLQPCPSGCTACSLVCDTGTCGADNGLASPLLCMSGGGEPPATLVEWTLGGSRGTDFYDLSNVDGFNTGLSVAPIPGRFTKVGSTGASAAFDCGAPACHIPADPKTWCPPELQVKSATGGGGVYCTSVCKAVTKPSAWPSIDNSTTYSTEAGPMTPRAYLQHMSTASDWRHPNHVSAGRQGMMKDLLCCICGPGATTGCEQRNPDGSFMLNPTSPCTYGCSPYSKYPAEWWNRKAVALKPDGTSGEMVSDEKLLDIYPDWPLSTVGTHYAKIYYQFCPTTYSWQFGDGTSTYQCKQADYLITVY